MPWLGAMVCRRSNSFGWRCQLREAAPHFLKRKNCNLSRRGLDVDASAPALRRRCKAPRCNQAPCRRDRGSGRRPTIRVGRGADANTIAAIVQALKASR